MEEINKTIVCLANSRKDSGRCIAGKEMTAAGCGKWIRPVSARPSAEVSEDERRYKDGTQPEVLDIITIRMLAATPMLHQSENYTFDADYYWVKAGRCEWLHIKDMLDTPAAIWANGDSTYNGMNDRVKVEIASKLTGSLMIVEPNNLTVNVGVEGALFGNTKRRLRANFRYNDVPYGLIVTDPVAERDFLSRPDGNYEVRNTYLTVSLGAAHTDGSCYKLVAAMMGKQAL